MENRFDFITGVVAVCVAGYATVMLHHVAHDDLGFSSAQIGQGGVQAAWEALKARTPPEDFAAAYKENEHSGRRLKVASCPITG